MRYSYADTLDENVEPLGGLVAKSRGGALDASDYTSLPPIRPWPRDVDQRGPRAIRGARSDRRSLDPRCSGAMRPARSRAGRPWNRRGVGASGRQLFTPGPDASRCQALNTLSYYRAATPVKSGVDFNTSTRTGDDLPLHFGGQYIFAALPAIPGVSCRRQSQRFRPLRSACQRRISRATAIPNADIRTSDLSLFGKTTGVSGRT